jgi:hypothetical protein
LKWKANCFEKDVTGKLIIPEITQEEKSAKEIEMKLELDNKDEQVHKVLKTFVVDDIHSKLDVFIRDIQSGALYKNEFSLPTPTTPSTQNKNTWK